jgi:hypothetical protein
MGELCVGGVCQCNGGAACPAGNFCCTDGCTDVSTSNTHCGSCTAAGCTPPDTCQKGSCMPSTCPMQCTNGNTCVNMHCICMGDPIVETCTTPNSCCGAAGCVDTTTNHDNCGGCGNGCSGDQQCCDSKCVGFNDPNNCGKCGNVCGAPDGGVNTGPPACCPCQNTFVCGLGGKCPVCVGGGGTGGTGGGPPPPL